MVFNQNITANNTHEHLLSNSPNTTNITPV